MDGQRKMPIRSKVPLEAVFSGGISSKEYTLKVVLTVCAVLPSMEAHCFPESMKSAMTFQSCVRKEALVCHYCFNDRILKGSRWSRT